MKRTLTFAAVLVMALVTVPSIAFAAKPVGGSKPAPTVEMKGYDVSYPQCGRTLPTDHYFGIVGVNGGNAATFNPCLADQLAWANSAKTGSKQDKVQLYVNTANPATDSTYGWGSWPTSGETPYGSCTGERTNDQACSWQYGWNRSAEAEAYFAEKAQEAGLASASTGDYTWWLDVETMNSWQAGDQDALKRNVAALEGFAAYYQSKSADVGLYSTEVQWNEITGDNLGGSSNLNGLSNWRPSGASLKNAIANCDVPPLTSGGSIVLTQYVRKNLDHDHSCI